MSFAVATGVTPAASSHYHADIHQGWDIAGVTNGGYLMAIVARAMASEADGRRLISVTGHFMNPGHAGPVEIAIESLKSGRGLTTMRGVMTAGDVPWLAVTASFSALPSLDEPSLLERRPPDLPPPDECVRAVPSTTGSFPPPFTAQVDIRVHPEDAGGVVGDPTGTARVRGWFRLRDGEPIDDLAVVLAADSFPPAVFNAGLPLAWTPTLDLTVHVREPGPHQWLRCSFQTRFVTGGLLEEDGEIWRDDGKLVALSRQLAMVGR